MRIPPPRPAERRRGLTLIEVSISLAVVGVLMLAAVSAFTSNVGAVNRSRVLTGASIFLEATLENLDAETVDALLARNGDRIYDGAAAADSSYAADLTVFPAAADLIQVEVELIDLRRERSLGRVVQLKARR